MGQIHNLIDKYHIVFKYLLIYCLENCTIMKYHKAYAL